MGLLRNFGGLPAQKNDIVNKFMEKVGEGCKLDVNVDDLVRQNLKDKLARHLMLITNGDSAIGILERSLKMLDREYVVIFGSQFEEDQQEEYNYRILSRIILCMESGVILVLRDLEKIYGSLYDMLNQNYTNVGKKRNCRIALGAYSNPMCHVHQDFRCIVLVDQSKVDYSDPPFLNRFEKQLLKFGDVLNSHRKKIIKDLDNWVCDISTIQGLQFNHEDVFAGYYQDSLASLVAKQCPGEDELLDTGEVLENCKRKLLLVGTPQGIFRATRSRLGKSVPQEVRKMQNLYFKYPLYNGLQTFLETTLTMPDNEASSDLLQDAWDNGPGFKTVVMTHSNIHTPIQLGPPFNCLSIKLGAFKSEKQLTTRLKKYWFEDKEDLLIFQCRPTTDAVHMLLAKTIIDNCRQEYVQQFTDSSLKKHVCILVHMDHNSSETGWQFNFLSGWLLVYLDRLDKPNSKLHALLEKSIVDILKEGDVSLHDTIKQNFLWALSTPIVYAGKQPSLDVVTDIICSACKSKEFMGCFEEAILNWLTVNGFSETRSLFDSNAWQLDVVCDKQALGNSSSLQEALQRHVKQCLSWPLAMIVYQLECSSAWASFLHYLGDKEADVQKRTIWKQLFQNPDILLISHLQRPLHAGCYVCDSQQLNLKFPFSKVLFARLDQVESLFKDDLKALCEDKENLDENEVIRGEVLGWQQLRFQPAVLGCLCEVDCHIDAFYADLLEDFCNLQSAQLASSLDEDTRVKSMKTLLLHPFQVNADDDGKSVLTRAILAFWRKKGLIGSLLQLLASVHGIFGNAYSFLAQVIESYEQSQTNSYGSLQQTYYPEGESMGLLMSSLHSNKTPESGHNDSNQVYATNECIANGTSKTLDHADTEEMTPTLQQHLEESTYFVEDDTLQTEHGEVDDMDGTTEHFASSDCMEKKPLEQLIVEHVCKRILPTKSVLRLYNGAFHWHNRINILLQLSSEVMSLSENGEYPSVLHYLRVCNDYMNVLLIPHNLSDDFILMDEVHDTEEIMESAELFHKVLLKIHELHLANQIPAERLQLFLCMYFGRILDAKIDTDLFKDIFHLVREGNMPGENLCYFRPVLQRILQAEDEDGELLLRIIDGDEQKVFQENSQLEQLDDVLKTNFEKYGWNSSLAALVVDVITSMYFESLKMCWDENVQNEM
ncbi:uncharacterized protein LOC112042729, partial [Lingula anatina]|uniref:Uncharacterized protein LOC112042729 n=1 Tax=Lingula anatina TaxID=7574 RepID=A0A2R2MTH6_LINAN